MRILYHYPTSPFSRRVRLALAHKGLDVELRDARANPEYLEEARRRVPVKTVPVLVDGDIALGESMAITQYLDHAYPDRPAIWRAAPDDAALVFEVASLVDVALGVLVDLGTRYYPLQDHASWGGVVSEMVGRAQSALDAVAARIATLDRPTVGRAGWSGADMWLFSATTWVESFPARAPSTPNIARIQALPWRWPAELSQWANAHRDRVDVRGLG